MILLSLFLSWMELMLFPRNERCCRFGSAVRWSTADIEQISLCSRVSAVMVLDNGLEISVSWLADAASVVRAGN